ncbi:MAG: hypothetical protein GYA16_00305, partial [Spirochaetes bacterium]|nr:hypothetical protein [Spirochaetota bacterium]
MKYSIKGLTIIVGMLAVTCINLLHCQTIIKPGNISGIWTKKTSPYIIKGDINIPAGKALIITPGVVVRFDGPYLLNVQGSLMARGTEKDSIVFTVTDTTGIKSKKRYGWNGIHFDRRPITWDTTYFRMPDDEMLRKLIMQYIEEGKIDTMARICISLTINDAVNDATLADSIFRGQQFSELTFCHFEFGTAMGRKQPYVFGGAVYIYRYSNLLIQHCTFENNFAYAGGAVYCKEAAPVLIRNHLRKCRAQSSGGAMVFVHSEPILVNNLISDNNADFNGGGILFYESYPCMVNNRVFRNQAKNSGGGMFCEKKLENFLSTKQYSMTTGTKFERNKTFENVILKDFHINSSDHFNGQFQNNLICQNKALTGAGIGLCATNPELVNMTIADNYADIIGGGIYSYHSAPKVINSILYGNMKDQVFLSGKGVPVFTYCNIEKDIAGIRTDTIFNPLFEYNNILNASPDFCNP